jgi:hypothetical protein
MLQHGMSEKAQDSASGSTHRKVPAPSLLRAMLFSGRIGEMVPSNLERAVALLQVQSVAMRYLLTQVLALQVLHSDAGDRIYGGLSQLAGLSILDEQDPEYTNAILADVNSMIQVAKSITDGMKNGG